jgi:hypothetical protein
MLFNPYTGQPRHPSDIASDPAGILMLDPDEPVRAFAAQPAALLDEFQLRGFLASKLLCWHRLTEAEAQNLVQLFQASQQLYGPHPF